MRIFSITNNYTPYSGGVTQSITATTQALQKQGHEVFIITLDFLGKKHNDLPHVVRINCPIRFRYKQNYMAIPWRPTDAISKLIAQHKPDIIHVHHPFLLGMSALRAARKHNIPCVFTYHTLYEEYAHYIPLPRSYMQPVICATVLRFCASVDALIAPSAYIKNYLLTQGIKTPISVIPSPLRDIFTQAKSLPSYAHPELVEGSERAFILQQVQDERGKKLNFFELLLVTRFVPEKNIPFVFEVMKLLPDNIHLILAGYGSDYEKLQKLAPKHVQFIYKPDEKQLLQLYRTADLFIFPSKTDTQGIVLAESMSQGVPVIAIDGPGQRDTIVNGVNGFIIKDAAEAAEKIMAIAQDQALRNTLIAGAQETAQKYHAHYIIKQLLVVYHNLC